MSNDIPLSHDINESVNEQSLTDESNWKLTDSPFFADLDDTVFVNPIGFTIPRPSRPHYSPTTMKLRKDSISKTLSEIYK